MDIDEIQIGDILRYYDPNNGQQTIELVVRDCGWSDEPIAFQTKVLLVIGEDRYNQVGNECVITPFNTRLFSKDLRPEKTFSKKLNKNT